MKLKRVFPILAATLAGALGIYFLQQTQAAPGQFAITPSSTSVVNGNNITVTLRIDPSSPASALDVNVSYDHTKLQYVSTNPAGSAFGSELGAPTGGGGTVHIVRGITPGNAAVSGDALIAQVTFKALAGSGSTGLTLSGEVAPFGEGGAIPTAPGSGTVSLTAPVVPVPAPPSPSPSPGPSPSPSPGPSPSPSPTTPSPLPSTPSPSPGTPSPSPSPGNTNNKDKKKKIEVRKRRIEFTRATLEAITEEKVRVYIKYGIQKDQLSISTPLTDLNEEHKVNLEGTRIVPGTTYYFKVVAEDQQGNTTESNVETFKTKGYKVIFYVGGRNEQRLAHKKVTLHSEPMTAETDENGYVTFDNVAPGNHRLEYTQSGQTYSKPVSVSDQQIKYSPDGSQTAETAETYSVIFNNLAVSDNQTSPIILPASVAAAIALAMGAFIVLRRRARIPAWQTSASENQSGQTGVAGTVNAPPSGDLINRISGVRKPGPGTIVAPNNNEDKGEK